MKLMNATTMNTSNQGSVRASEQLWDHVWLPRFPYATDDLRSGLYRMAREAAAGKRYVEANPKQLSNLLVVDIDHPNATLRALESQGSHPMPTAIVENPLNGHAHAIWALATPFPRTEYGSRKATAYAAAVTEGLRRAVDGDQGYSGLITKNPLHGHWATEWLQGGTYTLEELESRLEGRMPAPEWRSRKSYQPQIAGLGRNCSIFETARTWAYPKVRDYRERTPEASNALREAITKHVLELNTGFAEQLETSEAQGIATSIHQWITTRSRLWLDGAVVNEATFTTIQAARGHKSAAARSAKVRTREKQIVSGEA